MPGLKSLGIDISERTSVIANKFDIFGCLLLSARITYLLYQKEKVWEFLKQEKRTVYSLITVFCIYRLG